MGFCRTASFFIVPVLAAFVAMLFYTDMDFSPRTWPVLLRQTAVTLPITNFKHFEDYTEYDIPSNLSDKVILITGASSGIGYQSAKLLSSRGAKVILGIRGTRQRLDNITQSIPGQVLAPAPLELSDFDSVREFAESLPKAGIDHLDIVLLNAGKLQTDYITNKEGIESMLAGHHLGHAYLFELLTPLMLASPGEVRVVVTSSMAHLLSYSEGIRYNVTGKDFGPMVSYGNSKLANILYARGLSSRLDEKYPGKFVVNTLHPGSVASHFSKLNPFIPHFAGYNVTEGAMPLLRPAVEENVKGDGYYLPVGYRGDWYKDSAYWWTCNDTMINDLWQWTRNIIKQVHDNRPVPQGSLMLD